MSHLDRFFRWFLATFILLLAACGLLYAFGGLEFLATLLLFPERLPLPLVIFLACLFPALFICFAVWVLGRLKELSFEVARLKLELEKLRKERSRL